MGNEEKNEYITVTREPCLCCECKYFEYRSNHLVNFGNCEKGHFTSTNNYKCNEFIYYKEK